MTAKMSPASRPPRQELADQINRLDSILDGLSNAINQTIIQAVRDGARPAIRDAVAEFLADANLPTQLIEETVDKSGAKKLPSVFARLVTGFRDAIKAVK